MPGATLGLLFGIWLFQQQATLWSASLWLAALALCAVLGWLVFHLVALPFPSARWRAILRPCWVWLCIVMLAFGWAQARAWWRLQDALPVTCQQRTIPLQVMLIGVPERDARGQHVDVLVERNFSTTCHVPQRLRLHLYQQQYRQALATAAAMALPQLQAGERWHLQVRLKRPHATRNPHGFDVAAWSLANQVGASGSIVSKAGLQRLPAPRWQLRAWIARWRAQVGDRIDSVLGDTRQAAVVRALVIGDDSRITPNDWQLFVDSGINHLISISGLHITMLASLGYAAVIALWRCWPRLGLRLPSHLAASLAGAVVAIAYAALAGFSIPTQRTLYMLLTMAWLLACKRQLPFSWVLSAALWVVLVLDPWAVLAPGFWLSFGAVALLGLVMGGRLRAPAWWVSAWKTQATLTVAFVPVLWAWFNQLSLISPLANAIAIPLVSLLVVPLAVAGALLPVDLPLQLAASVMHACMQCLAWLHSWPWAVSYHATPPVWAWGLALAGVAWLLLPAGWPLRWAGLLLWLPMVMFKPPPLQAGQMRVTVIDVGQGLSVLVQTAHHQLLYDAGPSFGEAQDAGQRIIMPYLRHLGIRQLDMAMVSHDDSDHAGGMASVLSALPTLALRSSLTADASLFRQLHDRQRHLPHSACVAGQVWQWDGVRFEVLAPAPALDASLKDNDKSCVLRVEAAHGRLLLTGDIERPAEQWLVQHAPDKLAAEVLTIPHHGSKTSSTPAFIAAVHPQLAIASNGYLNRFGHPKPEVIARYAQAGVQTLRSDRDGAIILTFTDAPLPQVERWRQQAPHYWEDQDL